MFACQVCLKSKGLKVWTCLRRWVLVERGVPLRVSFEVSKAYSRPCPPTVSLSLFLIVCLLLVAVQSVSLSYFSTTMPTWMRAATLLAVITD